MADTYCGKTCGQCIKKQNDECVGCITEKEDGRSLSCEVASCCKSLHHNSCYKCGSRETCVTYHKAKTPYAGFLGTWIGMLFLISVGSVITSLFTIELFDAKIIEISSIIEVLIKVIYVVILVVLAKVNYSYKLAAIMGIVIQGLNITAILKGKESTLGIILSLIALVVGLVGEYNELDAHANVLYEVNDLLASKWRTLWNITICAYLALIVGTMGLFVIPALGANLVLCGAIGLVVIGILKLVYLYKTSKCFRAISGR